MRLLVAASFFLFKREWQKVPFYLGAAMVVFTMLWMPWYARIIVLGGLGLIVWGTELESISARVDGARTMEELMKWEENGRVR